MTQLNGIISIFLKEEAKEDYSPSLLVFFFCLSSSWERGKDMFEKNLYLKNPVLHSNHRSAF